MIKNYDLKKINTNKNVCVSHPMFVILNTSCNLLKPQLRLCSTEHKADHFQCTQCYSGGLQAYAFEQVEQLRETKQKTAFFSMQYT